METGTLDTVTLAKALSLKNRLAGRISQTKTTIETYNSVSVDPEGRKADRVDVRELFDRLLLLQEAIVELKIAISQANANVYAKVLTLAEKKNLVQMLSQLNTFSGLQRNVYGGSESRFQAEFSKPETLEMVRKLEAEIDKLQDQLNEYNVSTKVVIPSEVLELAR